MERLCHRVARLTLGLLLLWHVDFSNGFMVQLKVSPSLTSTKMSVIARGRQPAAFINRAGTINKSTCFETTNPRGCGISLSPDDENAVTFQMTTQTNECNRGPMRRFCHNLCERMDTLKAAKLTTTSDSSLARIFPSRVAAVAAFFFVFKFVRSKLLLRNSAVNEFQPNWGVVITSKEQEKNLHAWTCKQCGSTIFIAKGREFRFFNRFVECYNCGARGKDNFYDRRSELDDDEEFEYESPLNYRMSAKDRKKLLQEMEETKKEEEEEKASGVAKAAAAATDEFVEDLLGEVSAEVVDAEVEKDVEEESEGTETIQEAEVVEEVDTQEDEVVEKTEEVEETTAETQNDKASEERQKEGQKDKIKSTTSEDDLDLDSLGMDG